MHAFRKQVNYPLLIVGVLAREPLVFYWKINKIQVGQSPLTSMCVPCGLEKGWLKLCLGTIHTQKL